MSKAIKPINAIITDVVTHGAALFNDGTIDEAPARIDVMSALILESVKGSLKSRNEEVTKFVLGYEDACKYAKPVAPQVVAYIRTKF